MPPDVTRCYQMHQKVLRESPDHYLWYRAPRGVKSCDFTLREALYHYLSYRGSQGLNYPSWESVSLFIIQRVIADLARMIPGVTFLKRGLGEWFWELKWRDPGPYPTMWPRSWSVNQHGSSKTHHSICHYNQPFRRIGGSASGSDPTTPHARGQDDVSKHKANSLKLLLLIIIKIIIIIIIYDI